MEQLTKKTEYLTLLSVVSALAVVTVHANTTVWTYSPGFRWLSANFIDCLLSFAVPSFFMISGATLMGFRERYDVGTFVKKRFWKAVFPFLFWSIFGFFFLLRLNRSFFGGELDPADIARGFLTGRFVEYYWFFPVLFLQYALIVLFSLIPKEKREKALFAVVLFFFLNESLIPFFSSLFFPSFHWPLQWKTQFLEYFCYVALGALLSGRDLPRRARMFFYGVSLLGFVLQFGGTWIFSRRAEGIDETFKGYLNLPAILYSAGIFVFFKQTGDRIMRSFIGKAIRFLAPHTLSFYLLHYYVLFMILWAGNKLHLALETSLLYRLGAVIIVVPVCLLIDLAIRKIPGVKRILP